MCDTLCIRRRMRHTQTQWITECSLDGLLVGFARALRRTCMAVWRCVSVCASLFNMMLTLYSFSVSLIFSRASLLLGFDFDRSVWYFFYCTFFHFVFILRWPTFICRMGVRDWHTILVVVRVIGVCVCVCASSGAHYIYRKIFYAHGAGEEEEHDYA